jgi:hypothetical protein
MVVIFKTGAQEHLRMTGNFLVFNDQFGNQYVNDYQNQYCYKPP